MKTLLLALSLRCLCVVSGIALKLERNSPATGTSKLAAVVRGINSRFRDGQPSNDFRKAGVVLRGFDYKTDNPPFRTVSPWKTFHDSGKYSFLSKAFVSASIVNARMPYMVVGFENAPEDMWFGAAGLIISPNATASSLLCSYDADSLTDLMRNCTTEDCVPGCVGRWYDEINRREIDRQWCSIEPKGNSTHVAVDKNCAWQRHDVFSMMKQQENRVARYLEGCGSHCKCRERCCMYPDCQLYNELVLKPDILLNNLPGAIEAVYFVDGKAAFFSGKAKLGEMAARATQQLFLKEFKQLIPVVRVTNFSAPEPFELVPSQALL